MNTPNEQVEEIIQSALMGSRKPAEEATREIFEGFVVTPRAETCDGEVVESESRGMVMAGSGPEYAEAYKNANPNWLRNKAINFLNVADYIENRDAILAAKEAAATAARDKRRDELARDIHTKVYGSMSAAPGYANSNNALQEAIDRIIELESAA
jgi:phosphomannomutase